MRKFLVLAALLTTVAPGHSQGSPFRVYWIDVEGGAATLIVTPAGESVLVDAGNPGGRDSGRILKTAKDVAHLQKLDAIVLTHLHGDHFGGIAEVAAALPVTTLYENGIENAPATEQAQASLAPFKAAKIGRRVTVKPGDTIPLRGASGGVGSSIRFLAARQTFVTPGTLRPNAANCQNLVQKPVDNTDNANSLVMLVQHGPFRMFIGGDTTWNVEEKLVCPNDLVGPVDVYQSVHHGLDLSNNPVLVRTLQPHVVVFNNGTRKGYEKGAVATVNATPSVEAVYQVHRSLRDDVQNTADERIANREAECKGDGIEMSVAADGRSYEISVPSTGHRKTYKTR